MIPRSSARPHICLGCQQRIAKQFSPSQCRLPHRPPSVRYQHSESLPEEQHATADDPSKSESKERRYGPLKVRRTLVSPDPNHNNRGRNYVPTRHHKSPSRNHEEHRREPPRTQKSADFILKRGIYQKDEGAFAGLVNNKLRESTEILPSTTLGERSKVIVLRESILVNYDYAKTDRYIQPEKSKRINILEQIAEETGLVGDEEVEDNLNAFRPKLEEQPSTWEEINNLVTKLSDSFTVTQLTKYVDGFEERREPEIPQQDSISDAGQTMIITPWQPGISEVEEYFDNNPLRGYYMESHTSKQRVILELLRDCWMLELPSLAHGIGQFEVQLERHDLDLLLAGSSSVLNTIRRNLLPGDNEKLEVFLSRSVVRISTVHVKKEWVVQAFRSAMTHIRREKLFIADLLPSSLPRNRNQSIERWSDLHLDDITLKEVGRLTGTTLTRFSPTELLLSCVDQGKNTLNSPLDSVKRLLVTALISSNRIKHQLASNTSTFMTGPFVSFPAGEGLSWRDRIRHWTRWVYPTQKKVDSQAYDPDLTNGNGKNDSNLRDKRIENDPMSHLMPSLSPGGRSNISNANHENQAEETESEPREDEHELKIQTDNSVPKDKSRGKDVLWKTKYHTETSALFGSVLHRGSKISSPASSEDPEFGSSHVAFSTLVPNLSRFFRGVKSLNSGTPVEHLFLRFQPNPFWKPAILPGEKEPVHFPRSRAIGSIASSAFPSIELRLAIGKTKSIVPMTLMAIVEEKNIDVMLPDNLLDVRYHQRTMCHLRHNEPSDIYKLISGFLDASRLNLQGQGALETPPKITIPLSRHLLTPESIRLLRGHNKETKEWKQKDLFEVEYLFSGMEIRSTLKFEHEGWRMLYTSIEAGKSGGRRSEFSLRPVHEDKVVPQAAFVEKAYELARILGSESVANHPEIIGKASQPEEKRKLGLFKLTNKLPRVHEKISKDSKTGGSLPPRGLQTKTLSTDNIFEYAGIGQKGQKLKYTTPWKESENMKDEGEEPDSAIFQELAQVLSENAAKHQSRSSTVKKSI